MRVALFGGSGFIGRHLAAALRARGDEVLPGSLRDPQAAARLAQTCDAVVNLAGEPIAQRWNAQVKERILASRTELPRAFIEALGSHSARPGTYVSASAVGYYGTSESQTFTEDSPPGNDFLAAVCTAWEAQAQTAARLGMRVACVRTGLVLGADGGALERILPPFKMGAGGRIGSGRQWYSWIHVDDAVGVYLLALDGASGALNATAPNPVRNAEFTHALAEALHRPAALPVPAFVLKAMLGEGAVVVLEGQRVLPKRTQGLGYTYAFETLDAALADVLQ